MSKVVLVTGGSGLVGKAIEYVINDPNTDPAFRAHPDEKWYFVSSKEADLRCAFESELAGVRAPHISEQTGMRGRRESCLKSTSLRM